MVGTGFWETGVRLAPNPCLDVRAGMQLGLCPPGGGSLSAVVPPHHRQWPLSPVGKAVL